MRMIKKGAETMEVTPWIIVAVIAAVVVAYFVYTSFGKVSTVIDAQNVENRAAAASCQTSFLSSFTGSTDTDKLAKYCGTFIEPVIIGGEEGYANCEFLQRNNVVSFSETEISTKLAATCDAPISSKLAYNECLKFNNSKKDDNSNWAVYINGVKCSRALAMKVEDLKAAFGTDDTKFNTATSRYDISLSELAATVN